MGIMRPLGVHDGMRSHRHTNGSVYIPTRSIHSALFLTKSLNFLGSNDQKQSVVRRRFQNVRPTPSLATQGSYGANSGAKVIIIFERKGFSLNYFFFYGNFTDQPARALLAWLVQEPFSLKRLLPTNQPS